MKHTSLDFSDDNVTSQRKSISLVLPAWNEAESIQRAITEADIALRNITGEYEIIVVDDGSEDETANQVTRLADKYPAVRLVRHNTNLGYGASLRSGFAAARYDLVVFTDADNQFDLSELDRFVLLSKNYQVVCGYRIDRKDSALRCFYSRVYNQLVRLLCGTGVRDIDCAMKAFHRDILQDLEISTDGFLVNTELLTQARRRNYSLVEVGVSHRPRTVGQSTVSISHIPIVLASLLRYWWNQVQFPGSDPVASDPQSPASIKPTRGIAIHWGQILLLLVAATLLFTGLGYPLIDPDEARYGEIPREMLATGDWILPQLNFRPYYDKPVLLYWLCAASYSIFGVSEWSARLAPALCGFGTLLATMWFGTRLLGKRVGLLASVVLFLSVGFLGTSRILIIDGVLTFCTTISLFAAYEAMRRETFRIGWWTIASIACGVAFLAKGPIALVLLVPPVYAFAWLSNEGSKPRKKHWLMLIGIVTATAAPWFISVSLQDPQFAYEFFYRHNVMRFAGGFHEQPFWYFLPVVMIAGHPWTFLTIPYVGFLTSRMEVARRRRTRTIGFMLLWSVWCLAFFSLSKCKLPSYILPAAPAVALMIGHYLEQALFTSDTSWFLSFSRKASPWLSAGATCLAGAGFALFALLTDLEVPEIAWAIIATWAILLTAVILLWRRRPTALAGWGVCAASAILLAGLVIHREMPLYAQARTVFGPGSLLAVDLPTEPQAPIVTVAREWSGIPFDLKRDDIQNFKRFESPALRRFASEHPRFVVVMRNNLDLADLTNQLPTWAKVSTVAERGRARIVMVTIKEGHEDVTRSQGAASAGR